MVFLLYGKGTKYIYYIQLTLSNAVVGDPMDQHPTPYHCAAENLHVTVDSPKLNYSPPLVSEGNFFQEPPWVPNSVDAESLL